LDDINEGIAQEPKISSELVRERDEKCNIVKVNKTGHNRLEAKG
jgi:hypothetical protein